MTFDERVTELIALGAATTANCVACLEQHVAKAREIGLPVEEIEAALEVGRQVRRGAGGAFDRVAAARLGTTVPMTAASAPAQTAARGCCG